MKQNRHIYRLLPLLLTLVTCGIATAQETQWQPFAELQAGVIRSGRITMPSYSTTLGLRSDNLVLGLRYRQSDRSPLHEADPVREVSMMLQHTLQVTPRLELYGGVATGFAIEHSRMTHGKPLTFSAEVNLGVRYYVSENVALTFNVGMGSRIGANNWQALAKQLPYDPRTIPTYTTATGGVTIGIPPKVKKVNLPSQLVVAGDAPLLISYH